MNFNGGGGLLSFNKDQRENLLSFLRHWFNLDFTDYSVDSLHRRMEKVMNDFRVRHVDDLISYLKIQPNGRENFLDSFTVNVTDFFRDPDCFALLRSDVLSSFTEKSEIKIWVAGCSTGEEVLSLAILLHEMNLLDRTRILATDISDKAIWRASRCSFSTRYSASHEKQYLAAGGARSFHEYLELSDHGSTLARALMRNVEWQAHDLINDRIHDEFDLILCRNVLIYFQRHLQNKVIHSMLKSLRTGGFFMNGYQENVNLYLENQRYRELIPGCSIYHKEAIHSNHWG